MRGAERGIAARGPRHAAGLAPGLVLLLAGCTGPSYPPKPPGPSPNILLVIVDTVRADRLGCYGDPAKATPMMDRLAAEGTRFARAYTSAPWTLPAHATLFTGRPPAVHRLTHASLVRRIADAGEGLAIAAEARLPGRLPTIASILDARGYETLGVSQNPWVGRATTLSAGFRTFWHLWDRKEGRPVPEPKSGLEAALHPITRHVAWWLDHGRDGKKPFFIFLNYIQPHLPYRPDWAFRGRYVKHDVRPELLDVTTHNWPELYFGGKLSEDDLACLRELYLAEVAQVDAALGELRKALEARDLLDRTAWIVASDHGECIGHHGFLDHQYNVYEDLLRVPLIVRWPGVVPAGRVVEARAELADILPTILGWIGEPALRKGLGLEGLDLFWDLPRLRGDRAIAFAYDANRINREAVEKMVPPEAFRRLDRAHRGILRGRTKLIISSDGAAELYDLLEDPAETRNRLEAEDPAARREAAGVARDLERILRRRLEREGDRMIGFPPENVKGS